jgi:hypothetical protein
MSRLSYIDEALGIWRFLKIFLPSLRSFDHFRKLRFFNKLDYNAIWKFHKKALFTAVKRTKNNCHLSEIR